MKSILSIDLLNSFYQLYHIKERNPLFRFIQDIRGIVEYWNIDKVIVCTDTGQSQWRLKQYPQYKEARRAKREASTPAEKEQLSLFFKEVDKFKAIAPMFGFEVASIKGVEADDLIAYFSVKSGDYRVSNLSSDTDLFQLLSPTVRQRSYGAKMKLLDLDIPQNVWVLDSRFEDVYGMTPHQYMQAKSLSGDTGDSIYSTEGLGEKSGIKLIRKYGSIEEVKANVDNLEIDRFSAKARAALKDNFDIVYRNMKLIDLNHSDETFADIFGEEGLKHVEEIKARIAEPNSVNRDIIKEYLFETGHVSIYQDFDRWISPFIGGAIKS